MLNFQFENIYFGKLKKKTFFFFWNFRDFLDSPSFLNFFRQANVKEPSTAILIRSGRYQWTRTSRNSWRLERMDGLWCGKTWLLRRWRLRMRREGKPSNRNRRWPICWARTDTGRLSCSLWHSPSLIVLLRYQFLFFYEEKKKRFFFGWKIRTNQNLTEKTFRKYQKKKIGNFKMKFSWFFHQNSTFYAEKLKNQIIFEF